MMELEINGKAYEVQADGDTPLLWVIRDELGMTGTKYGCGLAQCGACSVLVDGVVMRSCVAPVEGMVGRKITTIEAIEEDVVGKRVVQTWVKHQVAQCGYCQSGQVMAATALLKQVASPTDEQIAAAMVNLCRCGTYNAIKAAVHALAGNSVDTTASADASAVEPSSHPAGKVVAITSAAVAAIASLGVIVAKQQKAAKHEENAS
jgi:isoquinoline 1-oxidoreductase alpha subunit